jgi:hypothetical protein
MKFVENAGKVTKWWIVLLNIFFHCTHQIFINHRWSASLRIIVHIFTSFIKVSHPSPHHCITHGMFSLHLTKLTMNIGCFHISYIQRRDYRPHFTCGGLLYFLEHFKHAGWCLNVVLLSVNCVHAFQKDQQLCTHAHHSDCSVAAAISANRTYFMDTPRTMFICKFRHEGKECNFYLVAENSILFSTEEIRASTESVSFRMFTFPI